MKCERCQAESVGYGLYDYCAKCSKNLCADCMTNGCCGSTPAQGVYTSEAQARYSGLTDVEAYEMGRCDERLAVDELLAACTEGMKVGHTDKLLAQIAEYREVTARIYTAAKAAGWYTTGLR